MDRTPALVLPINIPTEPTRCYSLVSPKLALNRISFLGAIRQDRHRLKSRINVMIARFDFRSWIGLTGSESA